MFPVSRICMEDPKAEDSDEEEPGTLNEFGNVHLDKSFSAPGVKRGLSSTSSVHELLECPICTNSMYPPIYQCPNGHTLCSNCKLRVHNQCPTCRHELGSECPITGDTQMIITHLRNDHKVDMHDGCTFNHRYVKANPHEVENATWMLTVFNCFGQHFCLHFEAFVLEMAPVYMAFLRFMGEDDETKKFCYSLEVGGNGRKLLWQGVPRSIRDGHKKVRNNHDGLIIHRSMALSFSGGNHQELKLRITGRIWKEE
ncbi:E3 ubiquitin-protein ligase SINAT2 isoform X2 [Dendrobium catenatum]|uniref:E3 ubiquitin-protein ligase SINAT2 isoform X2 n=1 Tax=Dendrobium catenatum TaxID=906689 RepID=UPI0009F550CB|nr:E3 ubiquitin-protein ligase SINAT2 isoform X2 [Dendrobium catenatum]